MRRKANPDNFISNNYYFNPGITIAKEKFVSLLHYLAGYTQVFFKGVMVTGML